MNQPPESCDDYVFYDPTPGGSAIVVDGDGALLVEDFRSPGAPVAGSPCSPVGVRELRVLLRTVPSSKSV